ncbi:MAG: hypothetical protein WC994_02430 [Brumimicrobium sp.]
MKRIFLAIITFFFGITLYSQVDFEPKGSFIVDIGLPNNTSNLALKELVQGLVIINTGYQHTFDNTFSVAAGIRYGYMNINEFKNNIDLKGGIHYTGVWGKVGQEKYYGNFGLNYGVRIGYSMQFFATNKNEELRGKPYMNDGGFVEPTISFALMANERSSFSLTLGYAIHGFTLKADQLGIEQFTGLDKDRLSSPTSYFSIGFGYSFFFGKQ